MPAVASYAPRGQATRGPSRHRPQRVPVFRNDNWPPRPPAQPLPAPSFLGSPDSETLLRALPTPSFVTPPEDPPKPAAPSKAVIAASAVPLADWFADVVWALYLGPIQSTTGGNSGLAGADKAPQPLTAFVHAVLSQTLASPQCAALGLYYLVRLPVRLGSTAATATPLWNVSLDQEGHTTYTSVHDRKHAARAGFVAELYGPGGEDVPYRLAALALMLGNKWLDDHTFTNKTWHEVTHLSLSRLTALEQRALECFNYSLGVPNDDWRAWLGVLNEGAQGALSSSTVPIPMSSLAIQVLDRLEREMEVLVGGIGAGVVDVMGKGVIGDRRGSVSILSTSSVPPVSTTSSVPVSAPISISIPVNPVPVPAPASATEMELDELEMEQVEIDIDLDDGGPVPEELRRPVKVRFGAGGEVKEEDMWAKGKDAWEKEAGKDVWKKTEEDVWKSGKNQEMSWGKAKEAGWGKSAKEVGWGKTKDTNWGRANNPTWGKLKGAQDTTWNHTDTWNFMDEDQDEWERAVRAAGLMDDRWDPNPPMPHVQWTAQYPDYASYAYPEYYKSSSYKSPVYSTGYKTYDGIGKGAYEYPTKGVYYAPAYEAVPRDYEPGCVYEGGAQSYHFGCPRQPVPVPAWQKSSGCVLG